MVHPQVNQGWRLSKKEGGPTKHSLYITWYGTAPGVMYIVSSIGYLVQYQVLYILLLPGMIPGTWYQTDHPQNMLPWNDGCHVPINPSILPMCIFDGGWVVPYLFGPPYLFGAPSPVSHKRIGICNYMICWTRICSFASNQYQNTGYLHTLASEII
jgi:hypothetical protein